MRYFKKEEFRCKCCGLPFRQAQGELSSSGIVPNIEALVENVLDPVRERFGKPIRVNSGYRCPKHNREVGGVERSQHLRGEAADVCPVKSEKLSRLASSNERPEVARKVKSELERLGQVIEELGRFDQLIYYPTFIHVSWKRCGGNRKQVLYKR